MPAVIAEWNRQDLTQFVSGGSADFSVGGAGRTLSVVNIAERGNVLRYSGGANGATITQVFMFSVASGLLIPSTDERRDVDIEVEIYEEGSVTGASYGPFFMGDADTPLHGFAHTGHGNFGWQTLINNGAVERSGGTSGAANRLTTYHIRGRKPSGAPPEVSSYQSGWGASGGITPEPRRSGSTAAALGGISEFGASSTLGATWNSLSCDRIGLAFLSSGGNPAPFEVNFLSFKVIDPWA